MNKIELKIVSEMDASFLHSVMNVNAILDALNEVPTQLNDWNDAIKEWNADDDEEDFIIKYDDTPVGWIGINGLVSDNKTAYIKMIVILSDYHSKGIGYHAINQVIEMLKQRNYSKIALYTDCDNFKARACYGKCGFIVTKIFKDEMSNGKIVDRCKMEMNLYNNLDVGGELLCG